jgi:hypothetical protein
MSETKRIIEAIKKNPLLTNKQIVDKYGLRCHPNNLTNIRRRYDLPKSPRNGKLTLVGRNEMYTVKNVTTNFDWRDTWNLIGHHFDEIRELTKWRFTAELHGYKGTSLTLEGYKNYMREKSCQKKLKK